jgi:RNA polymerase sigma-70 factor, ECF subfamily
MSENAEFIKYYGKFKDKIYTFFMYRVNFNSAVAEDLTSEVFIKAFKNFENFDRVHAFSTWIYTIAKNHLSNYYRSKKADVEIEYAKNIGVDMMEKMDIKNELAGVMEKIYRLDDYSREVLLMRFVDGLDNNEIAGLFGKDEGTIRTQVSRALKKLRMELG